MKKFTGLLVLLLLCVGVGYAQTNRVTGTVTGADNQGLPGVNVLVGGTSTGTTTDADGKYAINAPDNASLVFSYISYLSQTVPVNNRSIINVKLVEDAKAIDEVIVTALGIKREAKTLGYATATVNAEQINVNRTPNFVSGLQGKMAGVNITTMGTGPAGTAKIRIRGQSSFSGNNSPADCGKRRSDRQLQLRPRG